MTISCINCTEHRRYGALTFYCAHLPTLIIEDVFKTRECENATRLNRIVCPNCGGTGWSGGQPCPCSE